MTSAARTKQGACLDVLLLAKARAVCKLLEVVEAHAGEVALVRPATEVRETVAQHVVLLAQRLLEKVPQRLVLHLAGLLLQLGQLVLSPHRPPQHVGREMHAMSAQLASYISGIRQNFGPSLRTRLTAMTGKRTLFPVMCVSNHNCNSCQESANTAWARNVFRSRKKCGWSLFYPAL